MGFVRLEYCWKWREIGLGKWIEVEGCVLELSKVGLSFLFGIRVKVFLLYMLFNVLLFVNGVDLC